MNQNWPTRLVKLSFLSFRSAYLYINAQFITQFFGDKRCIYNLHLVKSSKKYLSFALENIVNLVTFSTKVIFGKRELLVPLDPSKFSIEKFANG